MAQVKFFFSRGKEKVLSSCDAFHNLCAHVVFFLACFGPALPSKCTCAPFSNRAELARTEHTHVDHTVFIPDGRPVSFSLLQPRLSLLRFLCAATAVRLIAADSWPSSASPLPAALSQRPLRAVWRSHLPTPIPPEVDAVPLHFFAAKGNASEGTVSRNGAPGMEVIIICVEGLRVKGCRQIASEATT